MSPNLIRLVLAFVASLAVALLLTPRILPLAKRVKAVDMPAPRRINTVPLPRLGGIAIYSAFIVTLLILLPPTDLVNKQILGLLVCSTLIFATGVYDDIRSMRPALKFTCQFVIACIAVFGFEILVRKINNPIGGSVINFPLGVGIPFSIFWLMGMMNAVNWIDGLDGLAAGLAAIFAAVFTAVSLNFGQFALAFCGLALLGSSLGFLRYNFHPARIIMGDSGSLFLGFVTGALAILGGAKLATASLVMGVPIIDVAYVIYSRWRQGKPVYMPDKQHLHHRLLSLGLTQRRAVLIFYGLSGAFGAVALIPSHAVKAWAIALLILSVGVLFLAVNRGTQKRS